MNLEDLKQKLDDYEASAIEIKHKYRTTFFTLVNKLSTMTFDAKETPELLKEIEGLVYNFENDIGTLKHSTKQLIASFLKDPT